MALRYVAALPLLRAICCQRYALRRDEDMFVARRARDMLRAAMLLRACALLRVLSALFARRYHFSDTLPMPSRSALLYICHYAFMF